MSAPKPEPDGLRRYGCWAGNQNGRREDTTRCIEDVWGDGFNRMGSQCSRKRGHGPDSLYCKQHAPDTVKARQEKLEQERTARSLIRSAPHKRQWAYHQALEDIANGHNDPRALAREVLDKDYTKP